MTAMMEKYEMRRQIGPSICDASGKLSHAEAFGLFMDIASFHAEQIGVGLGAMAQKDLFWLTVKTQVNFIRRPRMLQNVTLETWPEQPDKMRGNRSYIMRCGEDTVLTGKTEWAVINTATHKLVPLEGIYPVELRFENGTAAPEPFARIADHFEGVAPYAEYQVRSTDIDVGGHMNNTAYVRMIMGSLSNEERKALTIRRMDVIFRASCYEGDVLSFRRKETEDGLDIRVSRGEETVLLVRIR